ncbi:HEAT repeat domain-containing protein [Arthrobacter sp. H20]|uniref:HEAT repeat domain-containing protein n=1 Tax=Arthrobacter sp. H20 TaxID=1267981 RepID=UPI00047CFD28|nr:HEAT repeat domain-containing protein [Arthrobacter sp. H20]
MSVTMEDVRRALDPDEVDYPEASRLGPDALPHLMTLVQEAEPGLAAKAAYLAGAIEGEQSADIVAAAATNGDARVRVAAAQAAALLPPSSASRVLGSLMLDDDQGVQKVALRSVSAGLSPEVRDKVAEVSENSSDPALREIAAEALGRLR